MLVWVITTKHYHYFNNDKCILLLCSGEVMSMRSLKGVSIFCRFEKLSVRPGVR